MSRTCQNRRDFLRTSTLGTIGLPLLASCSSTAREGIPTRPLGKTGERVSALSLGGYHIVVDKSEAEAIRLVRQAIDSGINFLDNAWEYHDGRAEEWMGKALQDGYRKKVLLMTKHHGRDNKTAMQHLEDSLRRFQTDVIDLWQFHEVIYEKDPEMIFGPDGAIEFAEKARRDGKVRFIGFTGHKDPRIHKMMLDQDYAWDAVQMPLSVLDAHYRSFEKEILPICVQRGIAVLAMKTQGGGFLQRANVVTSKEALQYVLNLPVSTIISGMDTAAILQDNIESVGSFRPMDEAQVQALLTRTREVALNGEFEPFKSSDMFDSRTGRRLHGLIPG